MTQEEMTEEQRKQVEELVNLYVTNEAKLYEDWHKQITCSTDYSGREDVGFEDTLEMGRSRFKTWCRNNLPTVRGVCIKDVRGMSVCRKWKQLQEARHTVEVGGSIVELVCSSQGISIPFPVTPEVFFAGLVLSQCLDGLCDDNH